MPRFCANLGFLFTEVPFLERFAAAAAAGFTAVELADPYTVGAARIAAELEQHGLTCALFNMPMGDRAGGERGLACLPDRVQEFRDGVAAAADAARILRCSRINCMAGRVPAGADPLLLRATLVDNVRFAARALADSELTMCIEPLSTAECPDFFLTGVQPAIELINEVGADNLRLQFDCYHRQVQEGDAVGSLSRLLPLVGHVQIGDVPGRHEPGTGQIPFRRLFAELDRLRYEGWVGAEYHPSGRTVETLGWMTTYFGSAGEPETKFQ
jgi:hydroxypyruvate isomerase